MKKKRETQVRFWGLSLWLFAILLVAAIVHLVSILVMPALAPRNAMARLSAVVPINKLAMIDTSLLPYEDPASVLAVCLFDLRTSPLRLTGHVTGDHVLTLSFHTERGTNFYGLNDRAAQRGRLDILLATREQIDDLEADEAEGEAAPELRLEAPAARGFILLRAVAERAGLKQEARDMLASLTCRRQE